MATPQPPSTPPTPPLAPPSTTAIDFTLRDNGSALAVVSLIDAAGLPATLPTGSSLSVPPWVSSDPAVVITPGPTGLTAELTPANPPVLATDVTITVGPATLTNADGTTVIIPAVVSQGIDVVGGGPVAFAITL